MSYNLKAVGGTVELIPLEGQQHRVILHPSSPDLFIPLRSCETSLAPELIQSFIDDGEFSWLCDELMRYEHSGPVAKVLSRQLFSYFPPKYFDDKRLLDFGCGKGASSVVLARLLPRTEIVGVELDPKRVSAANRIVTHEGIRNLHFQISPSGQQLPDTGPVDIIMLCAVYEHLLPAERRVVMPLLWSNLSRGGVMFINQTPNRYFPYEHHSTGLWMVNYVPDFAAHWLARHWSKINPHINKSTSWEDHLRGGIRGATEGEILKHLAKGVILQPSQNGLRDRADYWMSATEARHKTLKRFIASIFRICDHLLHTVPSMNIDVVIQKRA